MDKTLLLENLKYIKCFLSFLEPNTQNQNIFKADELCKGGFSSIYQGFYKKKQCVIKVLQLMHYKDKFGFDTVLKGIFKELAIMASCSHHNIAKIKAISFLAERKEIWIVQKKYCKTLLETYQHEIKKKNIKAIVLQIVDALIYIHSKLFVHCDLKLSNIMFKTKSIKDIVLLDFGNSKIFKNAKEQNTMVLGYSSGFCAPEVLEDQISLQTDIFALGIIMYEIVTGHQCWMNIGYTKAQNLINNRSYNFFKENNSTGYKELDILIEACVHPDFKQRPNAQEVRNRLDYIDLK